MATLSGNELMAYNNGFEDGFKTGVASVNVIWILSSIVNDGETIETDTTVHKTLAGVVAEIADMWEEWRALHYDSDEDAGKKIISRLANEQSPSLEEVKAFIQQEQKEPVVLVENEEEFDGLFQLTLQRVQLLN
jgi:hypothetical protein